MWHAATSMHHTRLNNNKKWVSFLFIFCTLLTLLAFCCVFLCCFGVLHSTKVTSIDHEYKFRCCVMALIDSLVLAAGGVLLHPWNNGLPRGDGRETFGLHGALK
jgi:hypothetical protein